MTLWFLIIISLIVQEGLSVTVLLLKAYQLHYPLFAIHAVWLVVTVFQIYTGFYLGKWIQKRFTDSKFERWMKKAAHKLEGIIGERGEEFALIFMSALVSPALAALGASWLEISFTKVLIFGLLGDLLWYISTWITVIGAAHLLSDVKGDAAIVIGALLVLYFVFKFARKK
ncbi:hypothetical protein H0X32_02255 [Patescibacteria group bacterium]|nr:hypothetical protein [Patescibacteria group bacterium]